ncbi:MAG: hemolysin D [Lysobacteraceae bacterium]|nr:MAG: hemolysin D [Xanthomonadaceae bacterium]
MKSTIQSVLDPRPILITGLLFASSLAWAQEQEEEGVPVDVKPAIEDAFADTIWVSATVVSRNDAQISAQIAGRVSWVAEVGEQIDAGEPLALIDTTDLHLDLRQHDNRIERLEAQIRYQQSQSDRLKRLAKDNNAAVNQLEEAESALTLAKIDLDQARINRERTKTMLTRAKVTSPFGGRVVEQRVKPGEFVNPGTEVVRLVDTKNKEIRANAPLDLAAYMTEGVSVLVQSGEEETLHQINRVVPVGDERSRMFEVRVAAQGAKWVVGSAVRVALPASDLRNMVAIPRDALVLRGKEMYVYRVNDELKAERVDITTGIGIGHWVEAIGELSPGDQLIVRGGERLQPGQAVKPRDVSIAEGSS